MSENRFSGTWQEYAKQMSDLFSLVEITNEKQEQLEVNDGFLSFAKLAKTCKEKNGEIVFIGNGASASLASHFSADIFKNAKIRTRVLTDLSLLTAMGNDICYEEVYATPLKQILQEQDILVAISSSGNSKNIINAAKIAQEKCTLITFSAFSEHNPLRLMGNINFYVPASTFGFAESCHATLLHYFTDKII